MDNNLIIGIAGLILTVVGFFFATNIRKNKTKIRGNENQIFNQQGKRNSLQNTTIGTQINHSANKQIASSPDLPVIPETIGHFSVFNYHKCTQCGRGFKIIGIVSPSVIFCSAVTCPQCGNVDRV